MLSCLKPPDPGRRTSRELEKKITEWMKEYNKAIKLLLLGSGESGKTTIIKQMKILHISGFSDTERQEKAKEIRTNILDSMQSLVANMSLLNPPIQLGNPSNEGSGKYFLDCSDLTEFGQDFYDHAANLWADPGIQECFRRSSEFQIIDCAEYFLNKLDKIRDPAYVPDDQDILYSRRTTTDIQKIEFEVKVPRQYGGGSQMFWMFDVGGQKGERKKWIQVFEGIHAVLFLAACSSFDQVLREDNQTNRLSEALQLFSEVWGSRFLQESGIILFLNKQDALEAKVQNGISIAKYFPSFAKYRMNSKDGDVNNEYHNVRTFIRDQFLNIVKENPCSRQCYWHYTTATDTNNVKTVFNDVHTMIISWNLAKIGAQ